MTISYEMYYIFHSSATTVLSMCDGHPLAQILGFQIHSTGFLSSLPYILRTLLSILFGYLSKVLEGRYPAVSLTVWRKVFSVFCRH